ncbi:ephrin type-B receptor 1-B-like [Dysidea avara]|uniref:ephrin type-B receptor 1-B-like n=1 Tax=Dysidea avara TaxID=196820 RepID=UPI0033341885
MANTSVLTLNTPTISTSSMRILATSAIILTTSNVNATRGAGSDGDSSSSTGVIGIIAGCVIGVIIFVVIFLLIIILLWYRKQKKGKLTIPPDTYQLDNHRRDCEAITENAKQHSTINNQYSVINHVDNGSVLYKNIQPDYDIPSDSDYSKADKPAESSFYYSNPPDTLTRDRPKLASNDYDSLQNPDAFSSAQRTYSNTLHEYSTVPDTTLSYSTTYEVSASMNTGDEEAIYSDPGHSEEAIYAYFESKRFRSISANTVRTLQKLGSGEFGVVHLGTWTDGSADPIQVAVKTLNSKCSESDRVKFLREAAIMGQFKNNHIVELYGVVTEKESTMIILEYMPKGDLHEFLIDLRNTTPPESYGDLKHDLLSFCRQISSGFSYLASKLFVHRDLAARNILVSSDDVCKIADFGMARDVSDDTYYMSTGGKIPVVWTAPEAIFYKKYSTQSDVWSIGCVMYEIWSLGHKPFEDYSGREYVDKITTGYRLPPPPGCPRSIYKLMIQCWNPVPNKRIDPSELSRTLQKSDRTLLPSSIAPNDSEELSTKLGASLETNSQLYTDLQNAYIPK